MKGKCDVTDIGTIRQLLRFGALALALMLVLAACDLTGDDVLLDGGDDEISDLGIVWQDDEFELTGTVSELNQAAEALTVSYPTGEGIEETVLVVVPDGLIVPDLDVGDLVLIRGTRDVSGALMATDIERIGRQGSTLDVEP